MQTAFDNDGYVGLGWVKRFANRGARYLSWPGVGAVDAVSSGGIQIVEWAATAIISTVLNGEEIVGFYGRYRAMWS